ncbi:hypothetical protein HETIRDRAFT_449272 [Heterobasidion irregulare TC 32-1]|uniref:Uncharacterized protein n=1 Tax=Heterobasidion irregulare (strain TC 32-1) TaxID=747525 RepID=W4KE26_HETIT|nr:uncharacterized protein HETIRDRAFT_449272 [Heterobasidion irregulare TC 32-1]ETW83570.1 hypothetical protein HETIRDRAFT_449272 [Heterobasidion irregulare TC 32-1]
MDQRVLWLIHDDDRALAASYNFNPPPPPPRCFPAILAHHPPFLSLPTQGTSTVLMCGAPGHPVIQPYALLISEIFRLVSPQLHQLTTTVPCATATAIQITSTPEPPAVVLHAHRAVVLRARVARAQRPVALPLMATTLPTPA